MKRTEPLGAYGTITKHLTFLSSESWKDLRKTQDKKIA